MQTKITPIAKTSMLIRRPVHDVYEAFVDPSVTTRFWFTKSTGRLDRPDRVRWDWEMYDVHSDVEVIEVVPDERITITWSGYQARERVEWTFTDRGDGTTYVTIEDSGFAGEPDEDAARSLAGRVVDVSVFLDELGFVAPSEPRPLRVAYHDACHLAHAQKVREAPQRLLRAAGHEVVVPDEWELCCGSAGTYNVEQPETAAELGRRKAANLRATGADVVAAGNLGCLTQIGQYLELPVRHTIQILDGA